MLERPLGGSQAPGIGPTPARLRESIFSQLHHHPQPLTELVRQRPNDLHLQLATAKSHLTRGQELLNFQQADEAIVELEKARRIIAGVQTQHRQARWSVLTPTAIQSTSGATLTLEEDGSVFVSGDLEVPETFTLDFDGGAPLPLGRFAWKRWRDERLAWRDGPGTHEFDRRLRDERIQILDASTDDDTTPPAARSRYEAVFRHVRVAARQSFPWQTGASGWSVRNPGFRGDQGV